MMIFTILAVLPLIAANDLVEVWGIARCPDTSKFVGNQLVPFYKDFSPFPENFTFSFHAVPTGGAKDADGNYINKCLHGQVECSLNKLQMCAKKYIEKDSLLTIGCIQGKKTFESAVKCIDGDVGTKIKNCAETQEGEYLLNDENSYRYNVAPNSAWLPWIQINGVRVHDAEFKFKKYMCELESMKATEQCKKQNA